MTDVEKSEISPRVEEFQIFQTTDVEKFEILPNFEFMCVLDPLSCKMNLWPRFARIHTNLVIYGLYMNFHEICSSGNPKKTQVI